MKELPKVIASSLQDPTLLDALSDQDILVCLGKSISYYAAWHSLFTIVRGVVIVQPFSGLQHLVQVARECGIATVQLLDADPDSIPQGSRIAVDGKTGVVTILEKG